MYVTIPFEHQVYETVAVPKPRANQRPERTLAAGASLFREGDEVVRLYEVTSGVLRLTRLLGDGRRQVIAFGYPGDIVGFPCNGLHHTDCDALNRVTVRSYSRSALEHGDNDPVLHQRLLQAALREISAMQDHFMMLGRKSALEKVASFLCVLGERVGSDLGDYRQADLAMSRADIADFLGLTTETVSRSLTQLRKCKVIALDNIHTVILLRPDVLLTVAQGDRCC